MTRAAQFVKNLRRFRLVTFDITDTLLRFERSPGEEYAAVARQMGIRVDQKRLEYCFRKEFKSMASQHPNFGCNTPNMTWQDWWLQLVEKIFHCVDNNISPECSRMIAETLLQKYRTRDCWVHVEGNKELLKKMREIGKCVGVISNSDPSLLKVLREMEIHHKFDFVLTSYDTGIQKPHAGIFQIPLQRYKISPHEALHIGNLYEVDYMGARNSGWCSLLITTADDVAHKARPAHVYSSLKELHDALETKDIDW